MFECGADSYIGDDNDGGSNSSTRSDGGGAGNSIPTIHITLTYTQNKIVTQKVQTKKERMNKRDNDPNETKENKNCV